MPHVVARLASRGSVRRFQRDRPVADRHRREVVSACRTLGGFAEFEVSAAISVGTDNFVWDPTEPIATRPLMCDLSGGGALLYCHDGNKNVSETISLYGTIAAHYEYSSFGKVVLVTSENESQTTANLNPYRFSSEHYDGALVLVYYNYRHYNLKDGRWIGRDPKTDFSRTDDYFDSAYSFVLNNSVGMIDATGMDWVSGSPNLPPVIKRPGRPSKSPFPKGVGTLGTFLLNAAAAKAIGNLSGCGGTDPCADAQDCLDCCNRRVAIALALVSAAYSVDCVACLCCGNPIMIAACVALVGYTYNLTLDEINAAHEKCLFDCLNN